MEFANAAPLTALAHSHWDQGDKYAYQGPHPVIKVSTSPHSHWPIRSWKVLGNRRSILFISVFLRFARLRIRCLLCGCEDLMSTVWLAEDSMSTVWLAGDSMSTAWLAEDSMSAVRVGGCRRASARCVRPCRCSSMPSSSTSRPRYGFSHIRSFVTLAFAVC